MRSSPLSALARLVRQIGRTTEDDISCEDCYDSMDHFAEMIYRGEAAAQVLPKVEQHLAQCADCGEEFQALLEVLRAESA